MQQSAAVAQSAIVAAYSTNVAQVAQSAVVTHSANVAQCTDATQPAADCPIYISSRIRSSTRY